MDIHKKIEHIRRQPEHIRMKYVWGSVGVCMFFILILWVFSIKTMFQNSNNKQDFSQIKSSFETSGIEMPSINDLPDKEGFIGNEFTNEPAVSENNQTAPIQQTQPEQSKQLQQPESPSEKPAQEQPATNTSAFPIE